MAKTKSPFSLLWSEEECVVVYYIGTSNIFQHQDLENNEVGCQDIEAKTSQLSEIRKRGEG